MFYVRQPKPAQYEEDGRERLDTDAALLQGGLDLGQRDAGLAGNEGPDQVGVRLQHGPAMAADLPRSGRAGLAHPPHQLDGCRDADLEPGRCLPDRAALGDGAHDPPPEVPR